MENIYCDKCKNDFEIKVETERVKDDVKRIFFICPYCKAKYISFYLNSRIEGKQEKIRKIVDKIKKNKNSFDIDKGKKLLKQYEELKKEIGSDMKILREKIEKVGK